MKHILKFTNTSKNGLKIYYINFELKKPNIKYFTLREFLKILNRGLTSKHYKHFKISSIWYHKKRINFKGHYKFFTCRKLAERVLRKLNNQKRGIK